MAHAKFHLISYAQRVKQQSLNASQESSQNLSEYDWIQIDGSKIEKDLILAYNGETDEIEVLYKDSTKELLQLKSQLISFKVFLKDKVALFFITRNELCRQFKVRFIDEKCANDFFNLMNYIISIERIEEEMNVQNCSQLVPVDTFEFEDLNSQKAISYACSQPSQLGEPFPQQTMNEDNLFSLNDDTLNQYVAECLDDPEFPEFVNRVQRVASNIIFGNNNTVNRFE